MHIKHLLLYSMTLLCSTNAYSMQQLDTADQVPWLSVPQDVWIHIIAPYKIKDIVRKTCKYFRNLASSTNEKILNHSSLMLSEKDLERFVLYHGALGNSAIVRNLLSKDANPNACDGKQMSLMRYAAEYGYVDIIDMLLKDSKLDKTKITENDDQSPFWCAMRNNQPTVIKRILAECTINYGGEALCYGAKKGLLDIVHTLLACQCDSNIPNDQKEYPLHHAAKIGHVAIMRLLIMNQADVNCYAPYNYTPLHYASENGHAQAVQFLLNHNANVNAHTTSSDTPLHCASRANESTTYERYTIQRSEKAYLPIITLLLDHGADVNARTRCGSTPLHHACEGGHIEVVKVLLNNYAEVNASTMNGHTPLHCATQNRRIGLVETLLKHGADVNAHTHDGWTPLHYAAKIYGGHNLVNVLLKNGGDDTKNTNDGYAPSHLVKIEDVNNPLLRNNENGGCSIQ